MWRGSVETMCTFIIVDIIYPGLLDDNGLDMMQRYSDTYLPTNNTAIHVPSYTISELLYLRRNCDLFFMCS